MIRLRSGTVLLLFVFLATSCASSTRCSGDPVNLLNSSGLTLIHASRAAEAAFYIAQRKMGCPCGISTVEVQHELTARSEDFEMSADGNVASGSMTERWLTKGCGESIEFDVTVTPDGRGGTDIRTSLVAGD